MRNHLPVPAVDPAEYELEVDGVGVKDLTLNLEQLKKNFPAVTVTATVMCAGQSGVPGLASCFPTCWVLRAMGLTAALGAGGNVYYR